MGISNLEKVTADPAGTGAEIVFTADEDMIVHSLAFSLVTDATAASRRVRLFADDGADVFFRAADATTQAASLTGQYSAFSGSSTGSAPDNEHVIAFPVGGLRLRKNDRLRTSTVNVQATDNFSAAVLQVQRL